MRPHWNRGGSATRPRPYNRGTLKKRAATLRRTSVLVLVASLSPFLAAQVPRAGIAGTGHDFGIVRQGEKVSHTFRIRNEGTAALTVQLVSLSQPGMVARLKPEIAPGSEGSITLEWTTTRVKRQVVGLAVVRFNDPQRQQVDFTLKGVVEPPVDILPFGSIFLSAFRGEEVERSVRIVNHEARPLNIERLEADSSRFSARVQTLEPGRVYEVWAKVKPDAPLGRAQEPLYVVTDHPTLPRLRILVNLLLKPDVYVNPDVVDFGEVALTEVTGNPGLLNLLGQTFLVKTRAGEIALKSVICDLPFLTIRQTPPAGNSAAFRIDVELIRARLRPGDFSGSIKIVTTDSRFPEFIVPVRGAFR